MRTFFLRVAHTHEDIDQLFGRLSVYIRHHLNRAETLADFFVSLKLFLQKLARPHERMWVVKRADTIRDWKTFLSAMDRQLVGHTGKSAPKWGVFP